jgi:hypothetical protein
LRRGLIAGAGTALALPAVAMAQDEPSIGSVVDELNVVWVLVAAVLVMFMQAGFAFLEIGFSRGKNAGMGIAKILVNFSIATIAWWACGMSFGSWPNAPGAPPAQSGSGSDDWAEAIAVKPVRQAVSRRCFMGARLAVCRTWLKGLEKMVVATGGTLESRQANWVAAGVFR